MATITIHLPDPVYQRVKCTADTLSLSLDRVISEAVDLLLPAFERDLPAAWQTDLAALALLSDAQLWKIAHQRMDGEQQARLEAFAEARKHQILRAEEQTRFRPLDAGRPTPDVVESRSLPIAGPTRAYRVFDRRKSPGSTDRMSISETLRAAIAERDHYRCAYCLTSEANCGLRRHLDHIIPQAAGGETTLDNLCLVCFSCNVYKGAHRTGYDPLTQTHGPLFHPLRQQWTEHFTWDEGKIHIIGVSPCGRATINVLNMNNPIIVQARRRWVSAGWHPPID